MSGKVKMIRQAPPDEMNIEDHEMAIKIRQKASYTNELDSLKEWVLSQPNQIVDGIVVPSMKMFSTILDPNKPTTNTIPQELSNFFEYILEEYRILKSEVRAIQIHCIKPMEKYSKEERKSTSEVTIKQCLANTSDRFVFFGGSKELLRYKIINIDQLRKAAKLPSNAYIPREFTEQVAQNTMIHMDLVTAISNRLVVDNKGAYMRPEKPGFRKGFKISKNPDKRWIVVLDIIATTEKFDTVLSEKLEMIGHIVGGKPDSKEAKVLESFQNAVTSGKLSSVAEEPEEDDAPLLVDIPENERTESNTELDNESDIEDVEIPSNLCGFSSESCNINSSSNNEVSQNVLDAL